MANGFLYAMMGYSTGALKVWKLDPNTGAVVAGPVAIGAGGNSDGQ